MVAEHDFSRVIDVLQEAQSVEGTWSPIDQVANTPQLVTARRKLYFFQETPEGLVTTLDISDGIGTHGFANCSLSQQYSITECKG